MSEGERDAIHRLGHRQGVQHALAVHRRRDYQGRPVLAATCAVLSVLPSVTMLQLGLVVALGVLLDTLVVRTLLVPALSLDVGRRIWWPSRLARRERAVQATEATPVEEAAMTRR